MNVEEHYRLNKPKVEFTFDVHSVRALQNRSKDERCIEQAAWLGVKKCEITYENQKTCSSVRDRLCNLGFTVSKVHNKNSGAEYWIVVSW